MEIAAPNFKLVASYDVICTDTNQVAVKADLEEAIAFANKLSIVSVDIETTRKFKGKYGKQEGLEPTLSEIVMFQFGDVNLQYVIDTREVDILELVKVIAKKTVVGQNLTFEYRHLLTNYGIRLNKVYDTMLVEQVLHNGLPMAFSLEALNKRYLNIYVDKTTRLEFLNIGTRPFTYRQIKYGAEDVLYPLLIKDKQIPKIETKDLLNCVHLEHRFMTAKAEISNKGLHFNKDVWKLVYEEAYQKQLELVDKLNNFVVDNFKSTDFVNKQLGLFGEGIHCNIQWSSPKQVIAFFDHLGICPSAESARTKLTRLTVEAKILQTVLTREDLKDTDRWVIKTYLSYSKSLQATSTFGIDFYKYVNPVTNRIHTHYSQIKNTGRVSSSKPNVQNIPSYFRYREAFDAPKGYKIVNADYSGQESVIFANKTLDPNLLEFYKSGSSDMHAFVASKIYGVPMEDILYAKELKGKLSSNKIEDTGQFTSTYAMYLEYRQNAKAAGFAIQYGGSGFTIANNLGIPKAQGDFVYDAYFKAFPGLRNYFAKCKSAAMRNGYITIDEQTKRKYYFPKYSEMKHLMSVGDHKSANKLRGQLERASLNYPIQGTAGSMTKLAVIYIHEHLVKHNAFDKYCITNVVHDEINMESKTEYAAECAKLMEQAMSRAADVWCKTVKMDAVAVIGDYWAH